MMRNRGSLFLMSLMELVRDSLRPSVLSGRDRMGVALVRWSWVAVWLDVRQLVRAWFGRAL